MGVLEHLWPSVKVTDWPTDGRFSRPCDVSNGGCGGGSVVPLAVTFTGG
ncbi:MAG: hypothetical protein H0X30_16495 [Anaerolineae bacterium]|nr:hypothetical protein [Anaerolineae bacterium]